MKKAEVLEWLKIISQNNGYKDNTEAMEELYKKVKVLFNEEEDREKLIGNILTTFTTMNDRECAMFILPKLIRKKKEG